MNRQEALEWLVQNVTSWPKSIQEIKTDFSWDFWYEEDKNGFADDIVFCTIKGCDNADLFITQQQWLDATNNMQQSSVE